MSANVGRGVVLGAACGGFVGFVCACGLISGASDLSSASPTDEAGGASSTSSASSSGSSSSASSSGTSGATTSSSSSSSSSGDVDGGIASDLLTCNAGGLLAYWKADEGTGTVVKDCGPNKANATMTAGVTWVMGRNGKGFAVEFTGDNSPGGNLLALDANATSSAALNTTGALTVSLWVYKVTDPRGSWALVYEGNDIRATMRDPNNIDLRVTIDNVAQMTWHHVAMVFRPSTAFEIWHNGTMADSSGRQIPAATPNYGTLKVGHIDDPNDAFGHMNGRIQHMRIFGRALSAAEIGVLANEPN